MEFFAAKTWIQVKCFLFGGGRKRSEGYYAVLYIL
jgi:hypothetical protein